jgi:hypothetical protein
LSLWKLKNSIETVPMRISLLRSDRHFDAAYKANREVIILNDRKNDEEAASKAADAFLKHLASWKKEIQGIQSAAFKTRTAIRQSLR